MTKVVALMSMSLDGYVADANDGVAEVFDWYFSGDVEVPTASGTSGMTFHVSAPSADHLRGLVAEIGAMLTGRRTFERADGWGGQHPWDIPAFVVTHEVPDGWPRPGSTVQFVTDGIDSAVARAKSAAAPKSVGVHGAQTIQQCLDARLLDEIHIDLAAVLLGGGVRLFDHLANAPVALGSPTVVTGVGVTHLRYPIVAESRGEAVVEGPFVPSGFVVPLALVTERFRLEPLGPQHNDSDYEAWASSVEHIRMTPGWETSSWPDDRGVVDNLRDLEAHADDFDNRTGFTYTVLDPATADVLGCLYIYPDAGEHHGARVRSWVRASRPELDVQLWRAVTDWLAAEWPFERVDYAERES